MTNRLMKSVSLPVECHMSRFSTTPTSSPIVTGRCRSVMTAILALLASLASLLAVSTPAHATTTGSYTIVTWVQPQIYNARIFQDGTVLTPPGGIPANATITSIAGSLNWTQQPAGMVYRTYFCSDSADQSCADVSPSGIYPPSSYFWQFTNTQFVGFNAATTKLHLAAELDDGQTGTIHQAVNPARYLTAASRSLTVYYSY